MSHKKTTDSWVTIGGRIQDYAQMARSKGLPEAEAAIRRDYEAPGSEQGAADDVLRGLLVYLEGDARAYYGEKNFLAAQSLKEELVQLQVVGEKGEVFQTEWEPATSENGRRTRAELEKTARRLAEIYPAKDGYMVFLRTRKCETSVTAIF